MTHFSSLILHPSSFLSVNQRIRHRFEPTQCPLYTEQEMLNTKNKEFLNFKAKILKRIKMFSNDDYEFEDLANQMSQTQINESGNIGGLSML